MSGFQDRSNFYLWAHETTNSARQTGWFLAASQVNESNGLGQFDDLLPNASDVIEDESRIYIEHVGLGLAEQNVQTFLTLYFGGSIAGVDLILPEGPQSQSGSCNTDGQRWGNYLDEALVGYEQHRISEITDMYFNALPDSDAEQDFVMNNLNRLFNFQGVAVLGLLTRPFTDAYVDPTTYMVLEHYWPRSVSEYNEIEPSEPLVTYWPNGQFDYTNVEHRIRLGIALVRINNNEPWR